MQQESSLKHYILRHVESTRSPVCGCAMLNPGWCHMRRRLESESVLIIGRKGSTLIQSEDSVLEVKPKSFIILPAGHEHFGVKAVTEPVSYYWFHFFERIDLDGEQRIYLPGIWNPGEKKTLPEDCLVLPESGKIENFSKIEALCAEILGNYSKPGHSNLLHNHLVSELLILLDADLHGQENRQSLKGDCDSLAKKLMVMVEAELSDKNASVKYFASKLGVNADYLGRCFKEANSVSLGQYIGRRRVELACSRLRESSEDIQTILEQCGFGSRRQFYDEFKRYTGKTPSQYRAESAYFGVVNGL